MNSHTNVNVQCSVYIVQTHGIPLSTSWEALQELVRILKTSQDSLSSLMGIPQFGRTLSQHRVRFSNRRDWRASWSKEGSVYLYVKSFGKVIYCKTHISLFLHVN